MNVRGIFRNIYRTALRWPKKLRVVLLVALTTGLMTLVLVNVDLHWKKYILRTRLSSSDLFQTTTATMNMTATTARLPAAHNGTTTAGPTKKPQRVLKVKIDERLASAAAHIRFAQVPRVESFLQDPYFQSAKSGQAYYPHIHPPILTAPTRVCSSKQDSGFQPYLMVLVLSSYRRRAGVERRAIRRTYGSVAAGKGWPNRQVPESVGLVFLLGTPPTSRARHRVSRESREHGDLLIGDFVDTYANLTIKVLFGLRWMEHSCPQVKYTLKIDDDTFVNIPLLLAFLLQYGDENSMYGHVYYSSRVFREGKWGVKSSVFPFDRYPPYLSGTAYVMSADAVSRVLEVADRLPLLPVEDALVTGVLPMVADVQRVSTSGFTHVLDRRPNLCEFVLDDRLVGNSMRRRDKVHVWNMMRIRDDNRCKDQH